MLSFLRLIRSRTLLAVGLSLITFCLFSPQRANAQERMYFWGDYVANSIDQVARTDFPPGLPTTLSLNGMDGGDNIEGVAVSPDSTMIVVAGSDQLGISGVVNLYSDAGFFQTNLFTGDGDDNFQQLAFSPDGAWVSFLADLDLNGSNALYVVPTAGGTVKRVSQTPIASANDVLKYAWASDSTTIVFIGDVTTSSVNNIWTVDVTAPVPAPVELIAEATLIPDRDVHTLLAFDSSDRVYFLSDVATNDLFRLYRADKDGSNLEQVPGTDLTNTGGEATVGTFGISVDGSTLAFSSASPDTNLFQVFTMPLAGSVATQVSNVQTTADLIARGPSFPTAIEWSPDGSRLALSADWNTGAAEADNALSAYVLPSAAPAGGVRVLEASVVNSDVVQLGFSSNDRLIVRADLVVNNNTEMYAVTDFTTADQDPTVARLVTVPVGGDVAGFVVLPKGTGIPEPPVEDLVIRSITDVGNDQGRQVSLVWRASAKDVLGSPTPITEYAVFRKIDPALSVAHEDSAVPETSAKRGPAGWHFLLTVPAFADTSYAVVAPTLRDSTVTDGIYYSSFLIRAATTTPVVFFDSAPDSGYSVDNLAPLAPQSLMVAAVGGDNELSWQENGEQDLLGYRIYRGSIPGFSIDGLAPLAEVGGTSYTDPGAVNPAYYKMTAVDFNGNESPATASQAPTAVGNAPGARFVLHEAVPNPFNPSTTIRFDIAVDSPVRLHVYDLAGRLVRRLVDEPRSVGSYREVWGGTDDQGRIVSSGVYLVQLRAGAGAGANHLTQTRRVVLVK